jgi:hypothetical protein
VKVASTPLTRLFNAVGSAVPNRAWRSRAVLDVMSRVAGTALRAGRVRLTALAPNGQRFVANPLTMWVATDSKATARNRRGGGGADPRPGAPRESSSPQRGMFVVGRAMLSDAAARPAPRRPGGDVPPVLTPGRRRRGGS